MEGVEQDSGKEHGLQSVMTVCELLRCAIYTSIHRTMYHTTECRNGQRERRREPV